VLSLPARLAAAVSARVGTAARPTNLPPTLGLFVSGAVGSFLPCAMVYAALFYAMLSGSSLGGALAMSASVSAPCWSCSVPDWDFRC